MSKKLMGEFPPAARSEAGKPDDERDPNEIAELLLVRHAEIDATYQELEALDIADLTGDPNLAGVPEIVEMLYQWQPASLDQEGDDLKRALEELGFALEGERIGEGHSLLHLKANEAPEIPNP